jgi:L-aspartate oxidase
MTTLIPAAFDVVVVGGGAAGLYAALCLPAHLSVALLTKETLSASASDWAQGGMAAAIAPDDSPALHIHDTLKAGAGLCEPEAVKFLVEAAPRCVKALVDMGVAFDRQGENLALTLEAAHSRRRVLHAADTTGRAVVSILADRVRERPNIQVLDYALAIDLWLSDAGACQGLCLLVQNQVRWLQAGAVVLATGGGGQVYAQTTNPSISTGDGVAMAGRAGAVLRDLEFMQFHPTALTLPGAPRFLISEAVRGEGAHLIDQEGRRFAFDYHPAGELAPRDVVSRAMFTHLQRTSPDPAIAHVWLDLRPIPVEKIHHRFPNILQVCQRWGVNPLTEPIPVAPAAHYWMGGVVTDSTSQTTIPQLYTVGETASTGVHGANRLASNSLLECLVFGAQLGQIQSVPSHPPLVDTPIPIYLTLEKTTEQLEILKQVRQNLQRLMWQSAGICREETVMQEAIAKISNWNALFLDLPISQTLGALLHPPTPYQLDTEAGTLLKSWVEVRNLLEVALLILKSADYRHESRGGHYRSDYPEPKPVWQVHTLVKAMSWSQSAPIEQTAPLNS